MTLGTYYLHEFEREVTQKIPTKVCFVCLSVFGVGLYRLLTLRCLINPTWNTLLSLCWITGIHTIYQPIE